MSPPCTCSFALGADVPMPTLALLPRTTELLCCTEAPEPTAVALVIPAAPFALAPMKVLLLSEEFEAPELCPTKVLLEPVVLLKPASFPKKELKLPVEMLRPASAPKKTLDWPVVLLWPA